MKRLLFFVLLFGLLFPVGVNALDYEANINIDVDVLENGSASITQRTQLKNNSNNFLASSVVLNTPFKNIRVKSAQVDGKEAKTAIENGNVVVQFAENSIDNQESAEIVISYEVDELIENLGSVYRFTLPEFDVGGISANYDLQIAYPSNWEKVLYSNVQATSVLDESGVNKLIFKGLSDKLKIYFGDYSLIESRFDIDKQNVLNKAGEISFSLDSAIKFLASTKATTIQEGFEKNEIRVNLEKYYSQPGITMIKIPNINFKEEIQATAFFSQAEKFIGIETSEPEKIYKILLSRLTPNLEITSWERNTNEEILEKDLHTDLDYSNALVTLLRSKSIPSQIVYGVAQYPDGNYYWHFWVTYLVSTQDEVKWKMVDPYLEDISGDDYFNSLPPTRMIFGTISDKSDLSELSSELFLLDIEKISFQNFDSPTANTGYIASQYNKRQVSYNNENILGLTDSPNSNLYRIVLVLTVFSMSAFLISMILFMDHKYKTR